ncbi:hypothetical protein [Streptomyces sp. WM6378]|uniref:hypothetical protein n=1 Tax=Streptomyces sp. WM6378 TaxID=1415557 RepID=UPI0006B00212|nr:hypothetical protein [Streptomyces sp. WM6378]KOU36045.1 hypothetical protein ADK54_35020 [Streptomyces sp. WM6378]
MNLQHLRMAGLTAVVVGTVLLPLAASAGPAGGPENGGAADDAKSPLTHALARVNKPLLTAPEDAAAHCGPELVSPEGVEAQTCVLNRGSDTWARTYYRNATGQELGSVLTLMGPDGRIVETNCEVAADDQPDSCETPHQSASGRSATAGEYSAVSEFFGAGEDSPLLLRSGSNSTEPAAR